jgi:hypothetical protein
MPIDNDLLRGLPRYKYPPITMSNLIREINLLSGRLEIQMRLIARIIAKMDPAFIENPQDPEVKRRSDLHTDEVIKKMKADALAQAIGDKEKFQKLQRYFKDIES